MRIAVSGAHCTGKTTLIHELHGVLPTYNSTIEPYRQLEEEGHVFAEMPGIEDFELQLERSIASILESDNDCLFDRCPLDLVAYLITHDEAHAFELNDWLPMVHDAMQRLDLIVFVPIEDPDRIDVSSEEHPRLRKLVDEELRSLVLQDQWSLGVPTLEVAGAPGDRAQQVMEHLNSNRLAEKGDPS
jgi:hypothetical protein